jgi:outer membrane protein assembly factor BamB
MFAGCHNLVTLEGPQVLRADQAAQTIPAPSAQRWPSWRGGIAAGVSPAEELPLAWSERQGIAWRTPIAGEGKSSPIVWDERVFLTTVVGQESRAQLRLLAVDAANGSPLWQQDLGRPIGATHQKNGHASATPATDGERVYAYFGPKGLFCFSVEGERIWHQPLAEHSHEWGAASSPVLIGNLVVQLCDSASSSFLVALDKFTGEEVWRTSRESNGCWTTPALARVAAANSQSPGASSPRWELVVNGTGSRDGSKGFVHAYDPWSGRPLWHVRGTADIACPTAIVGDELVVSTSGSNGPLLAIRAGGAGDVGLSHIPWQFATGGAYVPTGVIYQKRLYLVDDDGVVICRDVADGRQIWRERVGGPVSASIVAGAGRIYVTSEAGETYVLAAGDQFQLLATNALNEPCFATPAIASGKFYIRTQSNLCCIDADQSPEPDSRAASGGDANMILSPSDAAFQ